MSEAAINSASSRPMTSPVYWGVLGLVIERPGYGSELYRRFLRVYAGALQPSGPSHVYEALNVLEKRGFVTPLPDSKGSERQPKVPYQATQLGITSYADWLVGEVAADQRRQGLWVRQLVVFADNPGMALNVLDRVERQFSKEAGQVGRQRGVSAVGSRRELAALLVSVQQRIGVGGTITLLGEAREAFEARGEKRRQG